MQDIPMNHEENELSKLLLQHKNIFSVLKMIEKQAKIKPESISLNTANTVDKYIQELMNLDMEIKVLALQNPTCLPNGVNKSNYDEKLKTGLYTKFT